MHKKIWSVIVLLAAIFAVLTYQAVSAGTLADPLVKPSQVPPGKGPEKAAAQAARQAEKAEFQATKQAEKLARGHKAHYRGLVVSVDADSLVINIGAGANLEFVLTPETRIHIPTLGQAATWEDLNPGVDVAVQAVQAPGGTVPAPLTALKVQVVPGKPLKFHRVGVVTAYNPGVDITIQGKDGPPTTFLITADTKILPAERAAELAIGRRVTIICPRDVTGGPLTAAGIVVHPDSEVETED